jgi:hypothetical protein
MDPLIKKKRRMEVMNEDLCIFLSANASCHHIQILINAPWGLISEGNCSVLCQDGIAQVDPVTNV